MKHAFVSGLALFAASVSISIAQAGGAVQMAHAGGAHGAHAEGGHGAHGAAHGHPAPSQEDIAAMPAAKSIEINDCWIRLVPSPAPSAGYFSARNQGDAAKTLTAAASSKYGQVMLHQTTHTDGMSRMSAVDGVEIVPGQTVQFKPGSYHIMLEKPASEIKVGDVIPMQFLFASGDKAEAQCEVKPANTLAK